MVVRCGTRNPTGAIQRGLVAPGVMWNNGHNIISKLPVGYNKLVIDSLLLVTNYLLLILLFFFHPMELLVVNTKIEPIRSWSKRYRWKKIHPVVHNIIIDKIY